MYAAVLMRSWQCCAHFAFNFSAEFMEVNFLVVQSMIRWFCLVALAKLIN